MKKVLLVSVVLLAIFVSIAFGMKKENSLTPEAAASYTIIKKWELPEILAEVSAIDWIAEDQLAAVQDEQGIIFIYDLASSKIVDKIEFAAGGDYEGLRINEEDAFVLRSDGKVYEIRNFRSEAPEVIEHLTELMKIDGIDMEGLSHDPDNDRLLLATKDRNKGENKKDIYALDLSTGSLSADKPVYQLNLDDPIFKRSGREKSKKFTPSELDIDTRSGMMYFLDAKSPQLLITDGDAKPEALVLLEEKEFSQPEGLTFGPDGKLYISNEAGKNSPANILQVQLKE